MSAPVSGTSIFQIGRMGTMRITPTASQGHDEGTTHVEEMALPCGVGFVGRPRAFRLLEATGAKHVNSTSHRPRRRRYVPSRGYPMGWAQRTGLQRWLGTAADEGTLAHSTHQRTNPAYQPAYPPSAGSEQVVQRLQTSRPVRTQRRINPLYLYGMPSPPHLVVTRFRYRHSHRPPKDSTLKPPHASSLQTLPASARKSSAPRPCLSLVLLHHHSWIYCARPTP
jgi:hypothetical protein